MKINFLTILKVSIISIPLAIIICNAINKFFGGLFGGYATAVGFPIQYYYDIWNTPGIEFNNPYLNLINYLIYYIILTAFCYQIYGEIFKAKTASK